MVVTALRGHGVGIPYFVKVYVILDTDCNEEGLSKDDLLRRQKINKQTEWPDKGWQANKTRLSMAGEAGGNK